MITITYSLTPADIEEARDRSIARRGMRMFAAVFVGLVGILLICQPILFFRRWHLSWTINLFFLGLRLLCLWAATGYVGLQNKGVFASQELRFMGDIIMFTSHGKTRPLRWLRERGFIETTNLFLLTIQGSEGRLIVPKRALATEQEQIFRNFLKSPSRDARFVLDFFLTEADVEKVHSAKKTWLSTTPGRLAARVVCGLGAVFFLLAPCLDLFSDVHGGWAGMWRTYPIGTVFYVLFAFFCLWVATGQIGGKKLERSLNHFDQRRTYTFSEADLNTRRGDRNRRHLWKNFIHFRETQEVFILQARLVVCYIIPKSALGSYDVQEFRTFLLTKLPPA